MDMTKALKRHKQVGERAGGGRRAGGYKRRRLAFREQRQRRQRARLPWEQEERGQQRRSHLGRTQ